MTSVNLGSDGLEKEIDDFVEQSLIYENRSQFVRTACRKLLEEESDEFADAS